MGAIRGFWAGAYACAVPQHWPTLAEHMGGWERIRAASPSDLRAVGVPGDIAEQWFSAPPIRSRGLIVPVDDPRYPAPLREVLGAPPLLFVQGDPSCLNRRCVAVVGTRGCSGYGATLARRLGNGLAAAGIVVVSGLARGIDSHAHRGALQTGQTVAVLGHGLDYTAPTSNRGLRSDICHYGGAVISSWRDDVPPRRYTFPRRNRWIAGLSEAVVVVEAPARSGALYTATAALDIGRDTYAVPGAPHQANSQGCNWLLKTSPTGVLDDVDEFLAMRTGMVPPDRAEWLRLLFDGEAVEQVAKTRGMSTVELLNELAIMEAYGQVVRMPGQRYAPGGGLQSPRHASSE